MDDGYEERIHQQAFKRTFILKYPVVVRSKKRRRRKKQKREEEN